MIGLLGRDGGDVGSVVVPGHPGYVYVRLRNGKAVKAYNSRVAPVLNCRVVVKVSNEGAEILGKMNVSQTSYEEAKLNLISKIKELCGIQ